MKIEITDTAALPGWLQTHVSEGHLDLNTIPEPEDVTGLKTSLQKEREFVAEWKSFKEEFGTPTEAKAKIAELQEDAKNAHEGGDKALQTKLEAAQTKIDTMTKDHAASIKERDDKITSMHRAKVIGDLKSELTKAGFIAEAIDDVAATASSRLQFNDDGSTQITTTDGKPMIGNGADHGATLADLAKELAEAKPYAVRDAGKGGSGKQPGSDGGKPVKKWSEMTSGEKVRLHQSDPKEYERIKAAG